jgi:hypothetical protein
VGSHRARLLRANTTYFQQNFGISRYSIGVQLFSQSEHDNDSKDIQYSYWDYIWFPGYASYYGAQILTGAKDAAHEYTHAIQKVVFGKQGECTEDCFLDNTTGINFCFGCATHYLCTGPTSRKGSWTEGMADAFSDLFWHDLYVPNAAPPTACTPTNDEMEGFGGSLCLCAHK